MKNLEAMERATSEFRFLHPVEKLQRRKLLARSLNDLIDRRNHGEIDQGSVTRMTSELLELHLTGRVESIPVEKDETP